MYRFGLTSLRLNVAQDARVSRPRQARGKPDEVACPRPGAQAVDSLLQSRARWARQLAVGGDGRVLFEGAEVGYAWLVVDLDDVVWTTGHRRGVGLGRREGSVSRREGFR